MLINIKELYYASSCPHQLAAGTFIYIESSKDVDAVEISGSAEPEETLVAKGGMEAAVRSSGRMKTSF